MEYIVTFWRNLFECGYYESYLCRVVSYKRDIVITSIYPKEARKYKTEKSAMKAAQAFGGVVKAI